jgi:hypothetical protein
MCAQLTVLSETPIAAAIAGWVIPLSRSNTIWMRRRCASGIFPRRFQLLNLPFAAFAHPFPPNQFIRGKHIAAIAIRHPLTVKPAIQSALEVV